MQLGRLVLSPMAVQGVQGDEFERGQQAMELAVQQGFQDVEVLATFLEVCLLGLDLVLELLYYLPYRY